MQATQLWQAYQEGGDPTARDQLLTKHIRLVHHVARQVLRTSRIDAELDELVSAGTIGLMKAIEKFDPSRGLAFSTFAAPRIRGAILDDFRRRDHAPRSIRRKQRDMARAREALTHTLDRPPRDDELAHEMGIEVEKLWRWQREAERAVRVSLDRPVDPATDRTVTPADLLVGEEGERIEEEIGHEEEVRILREEILRLKEQERVVLSLYYFEDLKLHEIATLLGVTESRISQIRSKAVKCLRARMGGLREMGAS